MAETGTVAFKGDLAAFAESMHVGLGLAVKKIVLDLHSEVTALTPVDTGRLRAAWMIGVGEASEETPDDVPQAILDKRAEQKAKGTDPGPIFGPPDPPDVSDIDGTQPVFLSNNLEYAEAIEDGHSQQAPNGMLKVAIATIEAQFQSDGGTLITTT
jgi:hypothetical protein